MKFNVEHCKLQSHARAVKEVSKRIRWQQLRLLRTDLATTAVQGGCGHRVVMNFKLLLRAQNGIGSVFFDSG